MKIRFWLRFDSEFYFGKGFRTWHRRPIKSKDFFVSHSTGVGNLSIGIVLQGPIVDKWNFTLETIRLYRRIYPEVPIIVSTWRGTSADFVGACRDEGVLVLLSNPLISSNYGNLSRQKETSLAGIKELMSLGTRFTLKTRTDQRLYARDFLEQLNSLNRFFPRIQTEGDVSKSRIFITYQNSFLDRVLSGSDFLQYGETTDLFRLWNSLDRSRQPEGLVAEQVILGSYLNDLGWNLDSLYSKESWEKAMANVVGFIDASCLDFFWLKYSSREFLWRRYGNEPLREVTPKDWYEAMFRQGLQARPQA